MVPPMVSGIGLSLADGSDSNTVAPGQMVAVDIDNDTKEELAVTFSGYGLWIYDPTSGWSQLNTIAPDDMAPANLSR